MAKLLETLDRSGRVQAQEREIEALRAEIEKLRGQNERRLSSMRHCLTCEYRKEVEAAR